MDQERAQRFAEEWYAAWNADDLDAVLDHYADDVEMVSPLVSTLTGRDDDTLVGKDALRAYFVGVGSLVLHYRGAGGNLAAEVVFLDDHDND